MEENVIEKMIIPYNPSTAKVVQKDKYQLFAPIAKNGQVGMAAFDPRYFQIETHVVSFTSGIAERLEIIYGENGTLAQPKDGSIVKRLNELEENGSIELAPTLENKDTDKAPSVKAVSDAFNELKESGALDGVQSNWTQEDEKQPDYIKNRPSSRTGQGRNSIVEGSLTEALGENSHAEGNETKAEGANSHAEGKKTVASGKSSHAEGHSSVASGQYSHAEGSSNTASGSNAHAEGNKTNAEGFESHAEGWNTQALGHRSHAEGQGTVAGKSGTESIAHAEGKGTTASGTASHAEGTGTIASGSASHAEGSRTSATGSSSHAEGVETDASGHYSHAEGYQSVASGHYSHAEGRGTITDGNYQHVQGIYNAPDNSSAHIVGWGTSDANRKNIHTLSTKGEAWFASKISVGGTKYSEGKTVATEEYVYDNFALKKEVDILKEAAVGNIYDVVVDTEPSWSAAVGKHLPENIMSAAMVNKLGANFNYETYTEDAFYGYDPVFENDDSEVNTYKWLANLIPSTSNVYLINAARQFDEVKDEEGNVMHPPLTDSPVIRILFAPITIPEGGTNCRIKITPADNTSFEGSCDIEVLNSATNSIVDGFQYPGLDVNGGYDSGWVYLDDVTIDCIRFLGGWECSFNYYQFTVSIEVDRQRIVSYPIPKIISKTDMYADGSSKTIDEIVIPDYIQALDGYGLMYSEEKYNYLDFDNRTFVRVCKKEGDKVVLLDNPETVDVSAYLSEDAGDITVAPSGIIATDRSWSEYSQITLHMTYLEKL